MKITSTGFPKVGFKGTGPYIPVAKVKNKAISDIYTVSVKVKNKTKDAKRGLPPEGLSSFAMLNYPWGKY